MNRHLKHYLDSFRLKKEHGYTLLVDLISFGAIGLLLSLFGKFASRKAYLISQGKTTEQLKQLLLTDPSQAQAFLANLKSFMITFILGLVLLTAVSWLGYSFSRKLIWDYLLKKKTKYKGWNLLNLVLVIPVLIYLLMFGMARLILGYLFALLKSQTALDIYYAAADLFFLLLLLVFLFLAYHSFAERHKVWESIGAAFRIFKEKSSWLMFLLAALTAAALSLILWPINLKLAYGWAYLAVNGGAFLLFIAWLRIYVYRTVKD